MCSEQDPLNHIGHDVRQVLLQFAGYSEKYNGLRPVEPYPRMSFLPLLTASRSRLVSCSSVGRGSSV